MKKSVVIVAIVFFILGIIVGKNLNIPEFKDKSKNFETKTDNEEIGNVDKFIINDEWMKIGNFKCKKITESIDINFSKKLFITKDNELYTYSTDKIFSNGENYKKIETDIKFQRFIGNNALVDVDNNLYTYKDEEVTKLTIPYGGTDSEKIDFNIAVGGPYFLCEFKEKDYKNISYISYEFRKYSYLYLKDGNVYKYKENFNESDETVLDASYTLSDEKLIELNNDENIELFIDGTIKTNKGYYIFENKIINEEETQKYADVKPEYKLGYYKVEDKEITEQMNKIAFVKKEYDGMSSNMYIVTNEGEIITKGNW